MAKGKISPKGIAIYPRINKPDTEYVADGVYHVKLKQDTDLPDVAAFKDQIDKWADEAAQQAAEKLVEDGKAKSVEVALKKMKRGQLPYQYIEDEDGNDTNEIKVNFKMKAKVTSRKTGESYELKPKIFDAKNQPIENCPTVYSGSELRVAFTPIFWYTAQLGAGVKLQMEAVKVLKLVSSSGGGDADSFGFGDDDGDFDGASAAPFSDEEEGSDDDAGNSDSGDF